MATREKKDKKNRSSKSGFKSRFLLLPGCGTKQELSKHDEYYQPQATMSGSSSGPPSPEAAPESAVVSTYRTTQRKNAANVVVDEDEMPSKIVFEPFRIKMVQPIRVTTREERIAILQKAHHNLFKITAEDCMIDLLSDSGTGALSSNQWSGVMLGDESYAGASSYFKFEKAVQDIFGFHEVIPTHQGRAAEHLLFGLLLSQAKEQSDYKGKQLVVPNNTHFDTTRANIEVQGAQAVDLPCVESGDTTADFPFKGNMDLKRLEDLLIEKHEQIPFCMITITNNAGGGQPVSLENCRAVSELCRRFNKPFYIDACRFAENAWFVKERSGLTDRTPKDIAREIFDMADGCTMSAKKDGMSNMGGFIAVRDAALARDCRSRLVVHNGYPTYGGLSGRELESVAVGLYEAIDEEYLRYRTRSIGYVANRLRERGVPVLHPSGGHAVFIDAGAFCPHLPWHEFPGQAVALELYEYGGIRSCEIGSVMLPPPARHELVRLAMPRRTYTQSHMDYLIDVVAKVHHRRHKIRGVKITEAPPVLRHFTAHFERL